MPGICGFAGSEPPGGTERLLTEMIRRMAHHPWYRRRWIQPAPGVALGEVALPETAGEPPDPAPGLAAGQGGVAWLDGEVYGLPHPAARRALLESCTAGASPDSWLTSLHGLFSAAVWDAAGRRLLLVNDRFGMKPLYYSHGGGRLVFATEIKALLAVGDLPLGTDLQGLVGFFSFGQPLGKHTFFEAVRALPPGAVLEYRPAGDLLRERRYFRLAPRRLARAVSEEEHIERLGDLFKAAVERRLASAAHLGLSLSGGLDSRTILGVIDTKRIPVTTVCVGIPGCIDQEMARRLAALAGSRHCEVALDGAFLDRFEEHLRDLIWLTDGHHRSQAITLPTLPRYRELGTDVLLRGHAGELLHMQKAYDFSLDRSLLSTRDATEVETWLLRRLGGWMLAGVEGPLLKGMSRQELAERSRLLLRGELSELEEDDPPVHRVWRLFITQRLRRHVAMSLLEYGSSMRVRLPYLDNDLIDAVLGSPPALKMDERVQARILARFRPGFLAISNANTGVRIGAGPLRRRIGVFRRRALARLGLPGYQPYERLGLWLRRELKPLVDQILLDRRCLDRGILEPGTVRQVIAAHTSGRANHTFLLMALLIFEIGQRMTLEGEERQALHDRTRDPPGRPSRP